MSSQAHSDAQLTIVERALSAAGAAFISAVIVNPLDVAKTRLQAQAAGVPYHDVYQIHPSFQTNTVLNNIKCTTPAYKGTIDVLYKVTRQEGFTRLWRGTNASLALAMPSVGIYMPCYDIFRNFMEEYTTQNSPDLTPYVPLVAGSLARSLACISCYPVELARTRMQAFRVTQGAKPPGVWKTLLGVINPDKGTSILQNLHRYRFWWTGLGAQLSRDVPYSAICWSTLEPIRKKLLGFVGEEANATTVLGANFSAGFIAGTLASAATCPLDVAKTRRQIEKDPERALKMTTRTTLLEIWRDGGLRGLFTGIAPRVGRAGPSVGIVVSFYEVVKYALNDRHSTSS
ncbi:putative mitochondrial carrier domain-containing protein [Medicago truncatula]|uniref:Putative mitochondrial carrier domain-containing protein n=1 Tax=Medicago truncatula TaxID=3880 RepID=G7L414_MEDTR|nr:mitochondrial carrier protein MTM1 isoform X1 [Medicago truncatula]AES82764.2 substrate carrier family protein [Medicago truncatula]RHN49521.1 putative mitochondrial carrier domain-containing protein [Medicago truncatula]